MSDRPFYVGYLPTAPTELARFLRRVVGLSLLGVGVVAAALAAAQEAFPPKVFEWGEARVFVGWLEAGPAPALRVRRPGATDPGQAWSTFHLVGVGKRGAQVGEGSRWVELSGSLIYRDGQTMVEIQPGSIRGLGDRDPVAPGVVTDLGPQTLVGEIVDSKCFLGVMAPGSSKPHRACATRCISGGIPPVLLVRDAAERAVYLFLEDTAGQPLNRQVLEFVAEPVEISGRVLRDGTTLRLRADPSRIRRLES